MPGLALLQRFQHSRESTSTSRDREFVRDNVHHGQLGEVMEEGIDHVSDIRDVFDNMFLIVGGCTDDGDKEGEVEGPGRDWRWGEGVLDDQGCTDGDLLGDKSDISTEVVDREGE